jgi:hypothetical protein
MVAACARDVAPAAGRPRVARIPIAIPVTVALWLNGPASWRGTRTMRADGSSQRHAGRFAVTAIYMRHDALRTVNGAAIIYGAAQQQTQPQQLLAAAAAACKTSPLVVLKILGNKQRNYTHTNTQGTHTSARCCSHRSLWTATYPLPQCSFLGNGVRKQLLL